MTALVLNTTNFFSQSFVNFFQKLNAYRKANALKKQTLRELRGLTDRDLADIGMHRGQIPYAAAEAYKHELEVQRTKVLGGRI
mgnify:FL=1